MSQLLAVFRPPHQEPEGEEETTENLLLNNEMGPNRVEMTANRANEGTPECDINDYVNWIDSVQMTITAADVSVLTRNAESHRQLTILEDANHNEAPYAGGRTFQVKRVSNDTLAQLPSHSRMVREGTPNFASITPALQHRWKQRGDDAFLAMVSALYAKILIMMGLAFPMTEVISGKVSSSSYLGFYLYLYFGSILYFIYVFSALVWYRSPRGRAFPCCKDEEMELEGVKERDMDERRTRLPSDASSRTRHHHGSFYLRIGAVVFGVGSMIYSGLEFAQFFEVDITNHCNDILNAITPAARMAFTFIQMYFIFLNAKMTIHENRAIAYFGSMHTIATNMCIWLYVIIEETKHDVISAHDESDSSVYDHEPAIAAVFNATSTSVAPVLDAVAEALRTTLGDGHNGDSGESLQDQCKRSHLLGKLVHNASPFLFPCAIEYSLICAAILYDMWKQVGTGDPASHRSSSNASMPARRSRHHYSVDCAKSNKGLFLGIFVLVLTLISLLMFFSLNNTPNYKTVAIMEVNAARLSMLCMAFIAVLVGMYQVRELRFNSSRRLALDEMLLVFGQSGVISYNTFTIIAAYYHFKDGSDDESLLVLMSALVAFVQAIAQTLFILDASRRNTYTADQQERKPGREVVTFLLVANFAMWTFNTLEKSRADVSINPIQLQFYGYWPWIIITNVSMPLAIFYRFHSTVVLCEIWKRCYKVKPDFL